MANGALRRAVMCCMRTEQLRQRNRSLSVPRPSPWGDKMRAQLASMAVVLLALANTSAAAQAPGWDTYHEVNVNDISMAYRDVGAGEVLVLLHGWTGSSGFWEAFAEELAEEYRVIAPDLRMHGRTTTGAVPFTYRQAGNDVLSLMDSLGVERFNALGFSAGGMTLLHVATAQPDRVDAMVLIGTMPYHSKESLSAVLPPDRIPPDELAAIAASQPGGMAQARALMATLDGFKNLVDNMVFTEHYLATIRARTLIIHGDRDVFMPVYIPTELYSSIPDSTLWIVPNAGHWPFDGGQLPVRKGTRDFEYFLSVVSGFLRTPG